MNHNDITSPEFVAKISNVGTYCYFAISLKNFFLMIQWRPRDLQRQLYYHQPIYVMDLSDNCSCDRTSSRCGTCDESAISESGSTSMSPHRSLLDSLKAQPKEKCGYPCEFVDPPPTLLQSECSICLQILCQPHLISCCGHNYCKMCIEQVMEKSRPCPLCNEETFTVLHNKGLQRSLNDLSIYCSNRKLGCEWKGRLGQYEQHINEDPEPDHPEFQLLGCPYVEVECKHGCGGRMRRGVIAEHQNEQCPQRPFCCAYCREYNSIHADVVYRHWPVCKKYPMTCPNHCMVYAIERENMKEHLERDCPQQKVCCEFCFAGCEIELPREELGDHLESNQVEHMSMLALVNQRMAEDLAEKDEQIAKLSEDVGTKVAAARAESRQEIQSLHSENSMLKQELAELKSDMASMVATLTAAVEQIRNDQMRQKREVKETNEIVCHKITNLEKKVDQTKKDLSQQCFSIQSYVGLFPVEYVLNNFEQLRESGSDWQSVPFYSHLEGY